MIHQTPPSIWPCPVLTPPLTLRTDCGPTTQKNSLPLVESVSIVAHPTLFWFYFPLCSFRQTRLANRQGFSQRSTSAPLQRCCCCGLKMHEHPIWTAKKESGTASGGHGGAEQHGGSNVVLGLKSSLGGEMRRKLGGWRGGGNKQREERDRWDGFLQREPLRGKPISMKSCFLGREDQGMIN